MARLVNTSEIPGANLDPETIEDAARNLRSDAARIGTTGMQVVTTWSGLAPHYVAPEGPQLLAALDPVKSTADHYVDNLLQLAGRLHAYAAEIREIKARVNALHGDVSQFRTSIPDLNTWDDDPALIAKNDACPTASQPRTTH